MFATVKGSVKRSALKDFKNHISRANGSGIKAINVADDDELIAVELSHGEDDILLFTSNGRVLRFCEYVNSQKAGDADGADSADSAELADTSELADVEIADNDSDAESEGDEDSLSDSERIAKELNGLQNYLALRKSGGGIRISGRAAGPLRGSR